MTPFITFTISGIAIVLLISAKGLESKRVKPLFILRIISRGDIYVRDLHHKVVRLYSEWKDKLSFLINKQIPIHSKNNFNKLVSLLKERRDQYKNKMRNSKLLKKSDGISDFFKNLSDVEKGNGVINDVYENGSQIDEEKVE